MSNIISGRTKFSRVRKDDDYGINRAAEVELSFTVNEGEKPEGILDTVGNLVTRKVNELIGLAQSTAVHTGTLEAQVGDAPRTDKDKLAATVAGAGKTTRAPRAPRAPKPADNPASASNQPDPAAVVEAGQQTATKSDAGADPAAMVEDWSAAAPEVTDVDLTGACSRTAKEIGDATPIRHLIAEFAGPPPKQLREIPQALRGQFLERLKKLEAEKVKK